MERKRIVVSLSWIFWKDSFKGKLHHMFFLKLSEQDNFGIRESSPTTVGFRPPIAPRVSLKASLPLQCNQTGYLRQCLTGQIKAKTPSTPNHRPILHEKTSSLTLKDWPTPESHLYASS